MSVMTTLRPRGRLRRGDAVAEPPLDEHPALSTAIEEGLAGGVHVVMPVGVTSSARVIGFLAPAAEEALQPQNE